jgi:hypothetical protein
MSEDKFRGYFPGQGIMCWDLDTRSFRINQSDLSYVREHSLPVHQISMNYEEMIKFISKLYGDKSRIFGGDNLGGISSGPWSLKYLRIVRTENNRFLVFNRYFKMVNWQEYLTVSSRLKSLYM